MTDKDIEVIIKPIFTKMFDSNFSACEYGIECYKKGMEYQGIKELAAENENLIKQVRILKAQVEKMRNCANCKNYNGNEGFCVLGSGYGYNCNLEKWEIKEK